MIFLDQNNSMNTGTATDIDWDELLDDISDGNLIPVIGNEIYKFNYNGHLTSVDEYLSAKVFEKNGLPAEPGLSLAEAVDYLEKKKIYTCETSSDY